MIGKKSQKRLGRGLAELIGEMDEPLPVVATAGEGKSRSEIKADRMVPIELIRANPNNPRRQFSEDQLAELASSISEHGIVQPILVRPVKGEDLGGASYEIIAGERRWRAAQKAALHEVPVLIRDVEDKQALELAIIENVQRTDLDPLEEAAGYQQLIDEYDYTQADLGRVIGKSRSHVANTLRLLKLPKAVRELVSSEELTAGHARTLVTADDPLALAKQIIARGLSVRQAEALAQRKPDDGPKRTKAPETKSLDLVSADTRALERAVQDALGIKTDIRHKDSGRGEIRLKYRNLEQLDEICRRLRHS